MSDFMDTALNYQSGVRVEPNAKRWVLTNGIGRIPVCDVCAQPIYEGHIDCTCDKNHPEICDRPTYDQLKAQYDALIAETTLKCDGCFNIDADTTHNCRQRDRHDCDDNCPDIVEKCQCTKCED